MAKEYLAGISFDGNFARIAVLRVKRSAIKVLDLIETERNPEDPNWFLAPFREKTKSLRLVDRISVALDDDEVIRHPFPLDTTLTSADRIEQVRWELSQVVDGFDAAGYVHDLHVLRQNEEQQVADALVVAVARPAVSALRDGLADVQLALHKADTRFFGGLYALSANYPDIGTDPVCLCASSERKFDCGLVQDGKVLRYVSVLSGDDHVVVSHVHELMNGIQASKLFLWGVPVPASLTEALAGALGCSVEFLNPFRRISLPGGVRRKRMIAGREHQFSAAIGCALLK
jgi:hypothetical protein